jgi:feruloyl esterase
MTRIVVMKITCAAALAAALGATVAGIATAFAATVQAAASCESLAALALPNATITTVQAVAAGGSTPLTPLGGRGAPPAAGSLPAFCRVAATLKPSSDSDIKIEVWLPSAGWNGKFQGVGNGGWTGSINYGALSQALRNGYATASTDTGHEGGSGQFALGHPEKLVDFGWRAVHGNDRPGQERRQRVLRQRAAAFVLGRCSSGGKQASRKPRNSPPTTTASSRARANYWTHLVTQSLGWRRQRSRTRRLHPSRNAPSFTMRRLRSATRTTGARWGDRRPARCQFDPKALLCSTGDGPSCLTAPQVAAAQKIYAPAKNPRTGQEIFPGLAVGSEKGWAALAGEAPAAVDCRRSLQFVVFKNPEWDFRTLDFDRDLELADRIDRDFELNANQRTSRPSPRAAKDSDASRLERSADFPGEQHQPT